MFGKVLTVIEITPYRLPILLRVLPREPVVFVSLALKYWKENNLLNQASRHRVLIHLRPERQKIPLALFLVQFVSRRGRRK